jgi:hypothetical protein
MIHCCIWVASQVSSDERLEEEPPSPELLPEAPPEVEPVAIARADPVMLPIIADVEPSVVVSVRELALVAVELELDDDEDSYQKYPCSEPFEKPESQQ